jgi:hypothetical protein
VRSNRKSSGWGFKIDYVAAIAEDDFRIAHAASSIAYGLYRRTIPYMHGEGALEIQELWQLALHFQDVSATLGLSDQDVADLAAYLEYDIWASRSDLPAEQAGRVGVDRGKALFERIGARAEGGRWLLKDEAEAHTELRRAKASRARHVRNQEKYGREQRIQAACMAPGHVKSR